MNLVADFTDDLTTARERLFILKKGSTSKTVDSGVHTAGTLFHFDKVFCSSLFIQTSNVKL